MKKNILLIIFIITLFLLVFISYNIFNNITNFKTHREYLKKPVEQQQIMDWMTLNYLRKHYPTSFSKIFWNNVLLLDMKKTLKQYCEKNKLNCDELIVLLEKYKNEH